MICLWATKILHQEPLRVPKTYAYFQRMNDRIPCSFALLKRKQNVCSSTVDKKFPPIKVNKQTLFWKFQTQTSPVLRRNQVLSICSQTVYQSVGS